MPWMACIGITVSMTKNAEHISFDPVTLPWMVANSLLMNCTSHWFGGTLFLVCQLIFNLSACIYRYGFTEEVQMTAFTYFMLTYMHSLFSIKEERHFREIFYKERTIYTLKESFEGTLEALPEPLLVQTAYRTVYANSAYHEQLNTEHFKEEVNKII